MTAHTQELPDLLSRLERLERQNGWLKRVGVAALALVGLAVLVAARQPSGDEKREPEKQLVVRDDKGKERAWLGVDEDGPALRFSDDKGKQRLWLGVVKEVPALEFSDGDGKRRAALSVGPDALHLAIYEGSGKRRGWLVMSDDAIAIHLLGKEKNLHSGLSVEIDGTAIWQHDKDGKIFVGMTSAVKNDPGIALQGLVPDPLVSDSK